jgi:hypothetical protein
VIVLAVEPSPTTDAREHGHAPRAEGVGAHAEEREGREAGHEGGGFTPLAIAIGRQCLTVGADMS